jgi:hypothetical protein
MLRYLTEFEYQTDEYLNTAIFSSLDIIFNANTLGILMHFIQYALFLSESNENLYDFWEMR